MCSLRFLNWKIGFLRVIGGSISTYKEFQMARQTLTTSLLDCQLRSCYLFMRNTSFHYSLRTAHWGQATKSLKYDIEIQGRLFFSRKDVSLLVMDNGAFTTAPALWD